ncbi:MAG: AraC family transcriptional regulator [Bacteroidota bacterium]
MVRVFIVKVNYEICSTPLCYIRRFPDLQWLKKQADSNFASKGWPDVLLNVKSGSVFRDNIAGPLSMFSNVSGESFVMVDGRTSRVSNDYFFISNNTQRYTLEIKSAETLNVHFGTEWKDVEFYNKLYPKDDVLKYLESRLRREITTLEQQELLAHLYTHLLKVNRGEKIKAERISAAKVSTRKEIIRRLHLATDHIYNFYADDISLEELSSVSMLSKFHFLRAFKEVFGVPPHKFLNNVRISKSKELLKKGIEVSSVGRLVGIAQQSSFSRLFKNETGVYPTFFRK